MEEKFCTREYKDRICGLTNKECHLKDFLVDHCIGFELPPMRIVEKKED